jgi:peptide/nickel transport system substrate-binding protein
MSRHGRSALGAVLALFAIIALAACGSSSSSSSGGGSSSSSSGSGSSSASKNGGTITIASGTAPQSADNQNDFTTQGNELYSVVNTALLTFKRAPGQAGTQIVPALAKSLPTVSADKLTYTFTLRPGLKYSNGQAIKASDFKYAIQRALKLSWDASSFLTLHIAGAKDYAGGKAKSISGITADDGTGEITVKLTAPYGPILDVLALPGTAPLPQSTPMKVLPSTGTIGDGPYKWGSISAGQSYTLLKNKSFNGVPTTSLPSGHADTILYKVNSNVLANAQAVLSGSADVFDPGDTLPPAILSQVQSQAGSRYQAVPTNSTYYFFMAVNQPPFNKLQARQAVMAAIDDRALSRLASGLLVPDCHLIPTGIPGSSSPSTCPFGDPTNGPNMAKAQQLMAASGEKGAPVTVYGEERSPRRQWTDYLTDVLNKLGFKAQEKILTSQVFFQVIGNAKTKPQIGFADWNQDFPNPDDFVQLFNSASILPQNSENYGYAKDSKIDSTEAKLNAVPATQLSSVAPQWAALDQYMVSQGYFAGYGHLKNPKFYSSRLNFGAGIFSVEYQTDLTSLSLK